MLALQSIAEALEAGDAEALDGAIAQARAAGALVAAPDGSLRPTRRLEPTLSASRWRAAGFVPFHLKPWARPAVQRETLGVLLLELALRPELQSPPHWPSAQWLVGLHLPQAVNLADCLETGAPQERILAHCLASLERFTQHDGALQRAISARGLPAAQAFPLSSRYEAACRVLREQNELAADETWEHLGPRPRDHTPSALFCDPKPANFITGRSNSVQLDEEQIFRIDLDLMTHTAPIALQAIIALFSFPSESPAEQGQQKTFTSRLDRLERWLGAQGLPLGEPVLRLLWYHLVRNYASAGVAGDAPKRGAMASMLEQLIGLERLFEAATQFRDRLRARLDRGLTMDDRHDRRYAAAPLRAGS